MIRSMIPHSASKHDQIFKQSALFSSLNKSLQFSEYMHSYNVQITIPSLFKNTLTKYTVQYTHYYLCSVYKVVTPTHSNNCSVTFKKNCSEFDSHSTLYQLYLFVTTKFKMEIWIYNDCRKYFTFTFLHLSAQQQSRSLTTG